MKTVSLLALLAAILPVMRSHALDYTWGPDGSKYDGCWTNVVQWTYPYGHALPDKSAHGNATARIDNRASYAVTLPVATQIVATTELIMNVQPGETLEFNALDAGLLLGKGGWTANWFGGNPVQFNCQGSQLMQLYAESSTGPYDIMELTNAVVTLTGGEDSGFLTIDGGLVDFRDPCGVEWGASTLPSAVFHRAPLRFSSVVFTNGASLRAHTLRLQTCGATNILAFAGGDHYVDAIRIPYTWNQSFAADAVADTTFRLCGGAAMSAASVGIGTKSSSGDQTYNKTTRFFVEGEGTEFESRTYFTLGGDNSGGAGRVEIAVRDGAEMTVATYLKLNPYQCTTTSVSVVDASLNVGETAEFGQYASSRLAFAATNAAISAARCDVRAGVDVSLVDTVWTNCSKLYLGCSSSSQASPVAFRVAGADSLLCNTNANIDIGNADHASLVVSGGNVSCTQVQIGGSAGQYPVSGAVYTGELRLSGGVFDVRQGTGTKTAYVGAGYTSYGTVDVSGGELKASSLFIGWSGAGELNVSGGNVYASYDIRIGCGVKATETRQSHCRISGGEVTAGNSVMVAAGSGRLATLSLTGGRLISSKVYGSNGISTIVGDGGVIEPRGATTTLLYGFTEALLGSKGLTVDSPYAVTVAQSFANKTGVTDGALVLAGEGVKTLSAPVSSEGAVVAAEGETVFDPSSGTSVERAAAELIVTNGASVSFASGVTSASFKAVRLGSADSYGRLSLAPTTRLTVDSVSLGLFYVELADGFVSGQTYPFITVNGKVDAETALAWKLAPILSGRDEGLCYEFAVSDYDETTGTTVLSVVVSDPFVPSAENSWQGSASGTASWDDAGNWSSSLPDKTSVASFSGSSDSVASTVALPSAAFVGSLAFADRDYGLVGEGPLVIADSKNGAMSVSGGRVSVDVPLWQLGSLAIDVASGASLVLNGPVMHGDILKTGDGALFLNGEGSLFDNGFTAAGGLFYIRDLSIFLPVMDEPSAVLKDGTLMIDGEEGADDARFPFLFDVAAAASTDAVVVSNAVDVTFPVGTFSSGAIVKRGAGRATLEITRNREFTSSCGSAASAGVPPTESLDFPADGTSPAGGYSGLTVVEGELRVTAADSVAASVTGNCGHQTVLGTRSANAVSAPPAMTADGAVFGNYYFYSGIDAYVGEYPENARTQYIRVVNGGTFKVNTMMVGYAADTARQKYGTLLDVEIDGGSFNVTSQSRITRPGARLHIRAKNAGSFYVGSSFLHIGGPAVIDLENGSYFGRNATAAAQINCDTAVDFTANVSGGSVFACWYLNWYSNYRSVFTFNFDNGFWSLGQSAPTKPIAFKVGEHVRFNAREGGLGFDVPADIVWQLYHPVYGEGGIFKRGAGTLRVESAAGYNVQETSLTNFVDSLVLRCAGANRVEEGTLVVTAGADDARFDVSAGAALVADGAVRGLSVSGSGTLSGGTFTRLTIVHETGETPVFDGVTASSPVRIDLGRDTADPFVTLPKNLKVAELGDAPSSIPSWKLVGTGRRNVRGVFRVTDGAVYVDAVEAGSVIVVR